MRVNLVTTFESYENGKRYVQTAAQRIMRQKTVSGITKEIKELMRVMIYGQSISPITVSWKYEDIERMNVKGMPRLEMMKAEILATRILSAGDSAVSPHYTANPIGKPFDARVKAVLPLIEPFLRVASMASRKNAQRPLKRGLNKRIRRF